MNDRPHSDPLRNVLLLQGGGALGAYQLGVIEALLAGGKTPAWVVGTSIGAINGALLAGNQPHRRLERLRSFWETVSHGTARGEDPAAAGLIGLWQAWRTIVGGQPGFFFPRVGSYFPLGLRTEPGTASYYDVAPLRRTLENLVDFDFLAHSPIRLSVGAVDVESGRMRYFDSRDERIGVDHILASGALPPAFPAVEIGEQHFWDGGLYSNTPLEHVLADRPRISSLCFLTTLWPTTGSAPDNLRDVLERAKDIQYGSRDETLLQVESEVHRLRQAVSLLAGRLPQGLHDDETRAAAALGCDSVFHVVRLEAPHLPGEDQTKDIEFVPERVQKRRHAGRADTEAALANRGWIASAPPLQGLAIHNPRACSVAG
ncbi:MAG: patatin-like phospholipase family protein [Zoogloeaceae bacterium]|nr:patatin-like phospholipase family protein [Rhodocyclaceae bacterium]MCP5235285.1 patatin-like phospholipase family protein [Zoogloeaceae bacterium]